MSIILILLTIVSNDKFPLEDLLGEHYTSLNKYVDTSFRVQSIGEEYLISSEVLNWNYFELNCKMITMQSDNNRNIKSLTLHFDNIITKRSYSLLLDYFGCPEDILILSSKVEKSVSISETDNFSQNLRRNELILRQGDFHENPIFINWLNEKYQVKIKIRYENNTSQLTLSAV